MYEKRLARTVAAIKDSGLSQILISDPASIYYLTGISIQPMERLFALYLNENGRHKLFLNNMFTIPETNLEQIWMSDTDPIISIVAEHVDGTKALGIDAGWPARFLLPLMELHPDCSYVLASHCVDQVRACKDAEEQEKMRIASRINDACMEKIASYIKEGVTEIECSSYISRLYEEAGAEGFSFPSIVSFGANASDPHHMPDQTPLREGDCIVIDMGCKKDGYCSDMTRTYFFGRADEAYLSIHDIVREANEKAEAAIRPGICFCDLDKIARDYITEKGYGPYFTHRLGHSIGTECHEAGDVSAVNTDVLREGMTFSIEPGVYLPGKFGVRIEDLVIVTKDGCEILNHVDKHYRILE